MSQNTCRLTTMRGADCGRGALAPGYAFHRECLAEYRASVPYREQTLHRDGYDCARCPRTWNRLVADWYGIRNGALSWLPGLRRVRWVQVDHIDPIAGTGTHDPSNMQVLCQGRPFLHHPWKTKRDVAMLKGTTYRPRLTWGQVIAAAVTVIAAAVYLTGFSWPLLAAAVILAATVAWSHRTLQGRRQRLHDVYAKVTGASRAHTRQALRTRKWRLRKVDGRKRPILVPTEQRIRYPHDGFDDSDPEEQAKLERIVIAKNGNEGGWVAEWRTPLDELVMTSPDPLQVTAPRRSPLLEMDRTSVWDPIPVAFDGRGRPVPISLMGKNLLLGGEPEAGKALALDTPVPTPTGWTTMGALVEGDEVFDENGQVCRVTHAWAVRHDRPCYRMTFSDGSTVVADAEHQWQVDTRASRLGAWRASKRVPKGGPLARPQTRSMPQVMTTEQMVTAGLRIQQADRADYSVRTAGPLTLPDADLPIAPYTLGAWLGDGHSYTGGFCSDDPELVDRIRLDGYHVAAHSTPQHYGIHGIVGHLRTLGVLENKHVPDVYLRGSERQRRDLLAGLLDTDGHVTGRGGVEFTNTNERIAKSVLHLAATLGYKPKLRVKTARLYGKDCGPVWTVTFTPDDKVFYLSRKASQQRITNRATAGHRYITAIEPVPSIPVRCVAVDSPSHLFLVTEACIPTHNSVAQSATIAALALDVSCDLLFQDLKGGVEQDVWEACGVQDGGVPTLATTIEEAIEQNEYIRQLIDGRAAMLRYESKHTGIRKVKIEQGDGISPLGVIIDELAELTAHPNKTLREKYLGGLRSNISRGRFVGVIHDVATQRPSAQVVPTDIRDIINLRWALRHTTPTSSDMTLGSGQAARGFSAHRVAMDARGVGFLYSDGRDPIRCRAYLLDSADVQVIARRAAALRRGGVILLPGVQQPAA